MNTENFVAQLEQLKEEHNLIEKETNIISKSFRDKVVKFFINSLEQYGIDELLLLPLTPNGYLKGSLEDRDFDFECDTDNLIDCPIEVLLAGKITKTSTGNEVPIVTRFGLKDRQLFFHTTTFEMCKDGDLSFEIISRDNCLQPWHPISEYKSSKKLIKLLFTFMSGPGNWAYSKEHPECCFLNRTVEKEIKNRIAEYSGQEYLAGLFKEVDLLKDIDLSSLDASNATTVQAMFYHCKSLRKLDVSPLNTSKCHSFESMFDGCINLEEINFGDFNTEKGETMQEMFRDCKALKSIDLASFDTLRCENMEMMFQNCSSLESLDLSNLKAEKCTTMKAMFSDCTSLKTLDLSYIDASQCRSTESMFHRCTSLVSLDLTYFLSDNCVYMGGMFEDCKSLKSLDLSSIDTSNCNDMSGMFSGCSSLESLDLSNFNVKCVFWMSDLFQGCEKLQVINLDNWDLRLRLDDVENMFTDCHRLSKIYLRSSTEQTITAINYAIEQAGLKGVEIITS